MKKVFEEIKLKNLTVRNRLVRSATWEITVVGTFDSYTEDAGNGNMYMYLVLRNARFA